MSKVYYVRDKRLIIHSNVIGQYPVLMETFKKYPVLDNIMLKELSNETQMFFKNIYPKVLKETTHEWDIDESFGCESLEDNNKIKCQLCNHDIKNICQIKNKENGNVLKIGTECVKHFEFNKGINIDKLLEEKRYIKRLEKLDLQLPNIERIMSQWNVIIEKQNIYIKSSITEKYNKILEEIKNLYTEYTGKKNITQIREGKIVNTIKKLLSDSDFEKQKIIKYVEENKTNKLIPTKDIISYLRRNNDLNGIKWIDEDGIIKSRTLFRIREKEFVKSLIPEFNSIMSPKGIVLKEAKFYNNKIGYLITLKRNLDVKLFYEYSDFILAYGGIITNEEIFEEVNQLRIIDVGELKDEESIDFALGQIDNVLQKFSIEYDEYFYDYNDILWSKKKKGKDRYYILTKLDNLFGLLKDLTYDIKKYNDKQLYNIIKNNSTTLSNSEARDLKKNRSL